MKDKLSKRQEKETQVPKMRQRLESPSGSIGQQLEKREKANQGSKALKNAGQSSMVEEEKDSKTMVADVTTKIPANASSRNGEQIELHQSDFNLLTLCVKVGDKEQWQWKRTTSASRWKTDKSKMKLINWIHVKREIIENDDICLKECRRTRACPLDDDVLNEKILCCVTKENVEKIQEKLDLASSLLGKMKLIN
uniref:Uncharacterized protein n=1 Tax=Romanomermis culicivorax TaxID=13658 RepID=A0A915KV87_ROMCU